MSGSKMGDQLKRMLANVDKRLGDIIAFDYAEEMNAHCDDLIADVMLKVQSQVELLGLLEKQLICRIEDYREERLKVISAQDTYEDLATAKREAKAMGKASQALTTAEWNPADEAEKALEQADVLWFKASLFMSKIRREAMNQRLLKFSVLGALDLSIDHIGRFLPCRTIKEPVSETSLTKSKETNVPITALVVVNEDLFAASSGICIQLWNPKTHKVVSQLFGHTESVRCLARLGHNQLASSALNDIIKTWDLKTKKLVRTLIVASVVSLQGLPNGNLATLDASGSIKIWNPNAGGIDPARTIEAPDTISHIGVLSNGFLIACILVNDQNLLRVWNPKSGAVVASISTETRRRPLSLLVLSSDDVAVSFDNRTVEIVNLVDASKGRSIVLEKTDSAQTLAELHDGLLACGLAHSPAKMVVINTRDGTKTWFPSDSKNTFVSLAGSSEGFLVGASSDGLKMWSFSE